MTPTQDGEFVLARPVSVVSEANGEWLVVDANGVMLCRAPDEMWAYSSAACFNAFPPTTDPLDWNADRDGHYVAFKCPDCENEVFITRKPQAYP